MVKNVPFLILDFGLDVVDGVRGLHLQGDGFARKALGNDEYMKRLERK